MVVDIDDKTVGILIESAIVTALEQYVDKHQGRYQPKQLELDLEF